MYNARERVTRGIIKTTETLEVAMPVVYEYKAGKEVAEYIGTEQRMAAKKARADKKEKVERRIAKSRAEKMTERYAFVEDVEFAPVQAEYEEIDTKEEDWKESEKLAIASELLAAAGL